MRWVLPAVPNAVLAAAHQAGPCGLLELRAQRDTGFVENHLFDPKLIDYGGDYQNSQAHSPAFLEHMQEVGALLHEHCGRSARIVEVGCGKGDFVEMLVRDGFTNVRGFDVAYDGTNPRIARRYLLPTDRIDCDLLVLRHTLEHIQRPHTFMETMSAVFGADCRAYVEVPCLDWTLAHQAYFDITYEHVNYFNMSSLQALFSARAQAAGRLFGQQYLYAIARLGDAVSGRFRRAYESANWEVLDCAELFPAMLQQLRDIQTRLGMHRRLFVWGAATKGCLFLHHYRRCGGTGTVAFAIDINPHKIGKYLPGTGIPIADKAQFFQCARPTDLLVIANANYAEEIRTELRACGLGEMESLCL